MSMMRVQQTLRRKIRSRQWLAQAVRRLKRSGRRVVFTNGCFDVLHVGHVTLLAGAKRLGDVLIVGLNSDRSVRALKGQRRPLVAQQDRALVLAALQSVDYITVFHESTPYQLIARLRPDILIKGADWGAKDIVGRELLERGGGRVVRLRVVKGYSTSGLIQRIQRGRPAVGEGRSRGRDVAERRPSRSSGVPEPMGGRPPPGAWA